MRERERERVLICFHLLLILRPLSEFVVVYLKKRKSKSESFRRSLIFCRRRKGVRERGG